MMPPVDTSSAGAGSTTTRSAKGFTFSAISLSPIFYELKYMFRSLFCIYAAPKLQLKNKY
jgi:hypothetical protein